MTKTKKGLVFASHCYSFSKDLNVAAEGQISESDLDNKGQSVGKSGQWALSNIIHSNLTQYSLQEITSVIHFNCNVFMIWLGMIYNTDVKGQGRCS